MRHENQGLYFHFKIQGSQRKIHFSVSLSYSKYFPALIQFPFIRPSIRWSFLIEAFLPVMSLNESVTCFQSSSFTIFTGADLSGLSNTWFLSMAWIRFSNVRLSASPYTVLPFLPSEKGREINNYFFCLNQEPFPNLNQLKNCMHRCKSMKLVVFIFRKKSRAFKERSTSQYLGYIPSTLQT